MTFNFNSNGIQYQNDGGEQINNQDKTIIRNGEYTADEGYTGLGTVTVNVEDIPAVLEPLSVTPSTQSQTITPTSPIEGFSPVSVSAVDSSIDNNILSNNIKNGVTILGITGSLVELEGETQNVSLTDESGQTFTPTSGKNGITSITVAPTNEARTVTPTTSQQSLTVNSGYSGNGTITVDAVTSAIDNNIVPNNIKNGISILGTLGTYTGSGGGSDTGTYTIKVIDYDGTILKEEHLDNGDTFTLPSNPSHSGLVFQEWSSPVTITNNTVTVTNSDITIGAVYTTASGLSEFDITLTQATGLTVTLNMDGTKNWGDGTSDTLTSHTYNNYGDYTITCDGTSMTISSNSGLFGQTSSAFNYFVTNVRLANITTIESSAFKYCNSLKNVIIPNSVTSIGSQSFSNCYLLSTIIFPSRITIINSGIFYYCYLLSNVIIPYGVVSIGAQAFYYCFSLSSIIIPSSVTNIGDGAFFYCHLLTNPTIPNGVTYIDSNTFNNNYSLKNITIPNTVTSIYDYAFTNNYSLKNITIPNTVTSIGNSTFFNCWSLESITIPNSLTIINGSLFQACYSLKNITIPNTVTTINAGAFSNCYAIIEYDFTACQSIPTLSHSNVFTAINKICKIKVPFNLYLNWIVATNWNTYADYIDGGIPATIDFNTTPNNATIYVNGNQISGTSISYIGSSASYLCYDSVNNTVLSSIQTGITEGATVNITVDLTNYNKITLSTNVTNLDVIFTIDNINFNATDEGNGNYSINVVGSGTTVYYYIDGGESYVSVSGTIMTTGNDITDNITMRAITWQTFTRPDLSADGTLGGDSFAVTASSVYSSYPAYKAVDGNTTTSSNYWSSSIETMPTYTFYNPNLLKVSEISFTYSAPSGRATNVTIEGSNDNSNWTNITSSYSSNSNLGTLTITDDLGYKYHKLSFTKYSSYIRLTEMTITAQEGVATI